jgi:transcriptional regulator with XRE-family HTH domain
MTRDMSSFGEKLRVLRESREIALDEIAESTKISKRYLQALERNDFEELPGGVFAKGYIRTYAEYLGVNPEPLLEAYVSELQSRGEGDPAEDEKAARQAAHAALSKLAGTSPDEARSGFGPGAKYALLGVIPWPNSLRPRRPAANRRPRFRSGRRLHHPGAATLLRRAERSPRSKSRRPSLQAANDRRPAGGFSTNPSRRRRRAGSPSRSPNSPSSLGRRDKNPSRLRNP